MANTKAKWFTYKPRPAGAKPVYEPQRPSRPRPPTVPDTRRDYPLPGSYPGDRRRPIPEPLPRRPGEPMGPGFDPRFQPVPESAPRPVSPKPGGLKFPSPRKFRLPSPLGFLNLLDYVEPLVYPNPDKGLPPVLPYNYQWCAGPTPWPILTGGRQWDRSAYFTWDGACHVNFPLSGQVATNGQEIIDHGQYYGIKFGRPVCYWWRNYTNTPAVPYRGATVGAVVRVGPALGAAQPMPYRPIVALNPPRNPNIERWLPTLPDPFADPAPKPELQVGYAEPLVGPEGFANPDLPYQPDYQWSWQVGIGLDAPLAPSVDNPVDHPEPPVPPVRREPPRRGENQRKVITKTKAIGIALYKALNAVSESAEVVDAVYDALPADVRKRWEKERFPDARWVRDKNTGKWERVGVERPGDNFGQYGIDGADWKLQALYYNWHKVDVEKAIKNIIKNELSDRVIGGIQAGLPKNSGAAHSQGEMELGQSLDDWFSSEFGL